jgi:hypothetical protein
MWIRVMQYRCLEYRLPRTKLPMKNDVFWDVMLCGSCKNRRFGGTSRRLHQGDKNFELGTTLAVTSNRILNSHGIVSAAP